MSATDVASHCSASKIVSLEYYKLQYIKPDDCIVMFSSNEVEARLG